MELTVFIYGIIIFLSLIMTYVMSKLFPLPLTPNDRKSYVYFWYVLQTFFYIAVLNKFYDIIAGHNRSSEVVTNFDKISDIYISSVDLQTLILAPILIMIYILLRKEAQRSKKNKK